MPLSSFEIGSIGVSKIPVKIRILGLLQGGIAAERKRCKIAAKVLPSHSWPANPGGRGHGQKCKANRQPDCFATILEKLSANDAKSELACEKQTEYRQKDFFLSFYSSNEGRKLDNFLAAIEVRSRTIKLEGCPLPENVSQFLSSWIQIWPIASLCLCNCMSTNDKSELKISRVGRVTSSNQDSS